MSGGTKTATRRNEPRTDWLFGLHRQMVRIRLFEEKAADLVKSGELRTPCHLSIGQEAIAVGVCAALRRDDRVLGNHRSHGHYLAKGGDLDALMAELFCRVDGCSKGRGGSMHVIAPEVGFLGSVPMVAGTIPVATGAALHSLLAGEDTVAVSFFGDSATEEGVFHEALNFAALYKLPILFICENNGYSSHLRLHRRRTFEELHRLAEPYGIPHARHDGNDVLAVFRAASEAVRRARHGQGPTLLEFTTHRWRGHVGPSYDLDVGIRDEGEVESWMADCPIRRLEARFAAMDGMNIRAAKKAWDTARAEVEASVVAARQSPHPDPSTLYDSVFLERAR